MKRTRPRTCQIEQHHPTCSLRQWAYHRVHLDPRRPPRRHHRQLEMNCEMLERLRGPECDLQKPQTSSSLSAEQLGRRLGQTGFALRGHTHALFKAISESHTFSLDKLRTISANLALYCAGIWEMLVIGPSLMARILYFVYILRQNLLYVALVGPVSSRLITIYYGRRLVSCISHNNVDATTTTYRAAYTFTSSACTVLEVRHP